MTDIADLLRRQGETLKRSGKEYEWRNGSEKVTIRGNLFYHQYEGEGGDAVDFVRRFYNRDYPEAMEYLLGGTNGTLKTAQPVLQKPPEPFVLPTICGGRLPICFQSEALTGMCCIPLSVRT